MKKVLLALVAVFTMGMAANAQNAIGVRIETDGNSDGISFGTTELSFQHGLGSNRLEFDLGWGSSHHYNHFNLTGIYQWTGDIANNFGWYAGVGGQVGFWSNEDNYYTDDNGCILSVAGQVGLEYNFQKVPFQLSLDWRPLVEVVGPSNDHPDFHYGNVGFGIRYRF